MPNVGSWNGKWSGSGDDYRMVRKLYKADEDIANRIINKSFYYRWDDGWGASVSCSQVDSKEAQKIRKNSNGFCGYDWMVDSIIKEGKIIA